MVCWCSKILLIFLKQSLHNWILIKNNILVCSLYIKYVLTWHEASLAYNLKKMKVNSFFEIPEFNQQHHSKDVLDLLHFFASSMNNRFVTFFMYIHILCICAIATRIMTNKQTDLTPLTSIFSRAGFEKKNWTNLKILWNKNVFVITKMCFFFHLIRLYFICILY